MNTYHLTITEARVLRCGNQGVGRAGSSQRLSLCFFQLQEAAPCLGSCLLCSSPCFHCHWRLSPMDPPSLLKGSPVIMGMAHSHHLGGPQLVKWRSAEKFRGPQRQACELDFPQEEAGVIDSIYNRLLATRKEQANKWLSSARKGTGVKEDDWDFGHLQRSRRWSPPVKKSSPSGEGGWGRRKDKEGQIRGWGHTGDEEEGLGKAHFPESYSSYQMGPETPSKDMSLTRPWEVCSQILGYFGMFAFS